jgi:hypothetical protein
MAKRSAPADAGIAVTIPTQPLSDSPAQLLDIYEVMRLLRVRSRTSVYNMVKRKRLHPPRTEDAVFGRPRWRLSDLMPGA